MSQGNLFSNNTLSMASRARPNAENIITSFKEGNKMVLLWLNERTNKVKERRIKIGARQFKRLARQGAIDLTGTGYKRFASGMVINVKNRLRNKIIKWRQSDDNEVNLNLNDLGIDGTIELIIEVLYGENIKVKAGDTYYTLNDINVSRLVNNIRNNLVSADADGISVSDEEFQNALTVFNEITLMKNVIEELDFIEDDEYNENPNGSFFKWFHNTKLDLSRYGVFNDSITTKEHKKELEINCLIRALSVAGMSEVKVNKLKTFVFNRSIPMCRFKQVCQYLKIQLVVKRNDKHKNLYYYGKEFEEKYVIGLIENHYFNIEEVKITNYALKNYFELKEKFPDKNIYNMVSSAGQTKNNRWTNSFNIIKHFSENKETYLVKIPMTMQLLDTAFYDCIVNEELTELSYNETLDTDLNFWDADKEKWKREQPKPIKVFFDFETDPNQEIHKPYLVCRRNEDGSKRAFLNSYTNTGICNYDCGYRFMESLGDDGNKYLLIAHNAGYDYRFIYEYLQDDTIISKGNGLMNAKGKYWNNRLRKLIDIEIKDSYKLITMPLSKFGKCFSLQQEKEVMPYGLYTEVNIQRRIVPIEQALQHLNNDVNKLKKLVENSKKWGIYFEINNCPSFDIIRYSIEYCHLDCEIMHKGYDIFRGWILEALDLDIDGVWTIASLADKYLLKEGVYDGVYKLAGIPRLFIQKCVVGGRTMCSQNKKISTCETINGRIADYDGVSLYPSSFQRMGKAGGVLLGTPKVIPDNRCNMEFLNSVDGYFVLAKITKVGINRNFPLVSVVNDKGVRIFRNDVVGEKIYVDKYSLEDMIKFQNIEVEIIRGYYYNQGRNNRIKEVIEFVFNERLKKKAEKNPIQLVYKLIMNASYGRSILKPITDDVKIVNSVDELNKFIQKNYQRVIEYTELNCIKRTNTKRKFKIKLINPIKNHFNNCVLGVECLSMSKRIMNEVVCLAEDNDLQVLYTDTDSVHIAYDDVAVLEQKFQEKYNRQLTGKQLGQFHIDFDLEDANGNDCKDIYAYKSIFLGKKCYIDLLRGTADDGTSVDGYHIRMKGVPNSTIKHTANMLYNGNIDDNLFSLYQSLYEGNQVEFDLLEYKDGVSNRVNFKFDKNGAIRSMAEFKRELSFHNEVMVF